MNIKKIFPLIVVLSIVLLAPMTKSYAEENNEEQNENESPDEIINRENIPDLDDIPDPPRDESLIGDEEDVYEVEIETPSSVTGEKMEGSGTVVDFSTTGARAFYTIVDNDNDTFYLIIDMDKPDNNVYFLSDINKEQLASGSNATQNNDNSGIFGNNEGQEDQEESEASEVIGSQAEETDKNVEKSSNLTFLLIVVSVGLVGAFGYYFLVIKRRQNSIDQSDEDEEMSEIYEDEDIYSDQDFIDEKIEEEQNKWF